MIFVTIDAHGGMEKNDTKNLSVDTKSLNPLAERAGFYGTEGLCLILEFVQVNSLFTCLLLVLFTCYSQKPFQNTLLLSFCR